MVVLKLKIISLDINRELLKYMKCKMNLVTNNYKKLCNKVTKNNNNISFGKNLSVL